MYLALDLDGTLGDFIGVWRMLCILRQERFYATNKTKILKVSSPDFQWKLDIAYDSFVREMVLREGVPFFRPGIFSVFREIVRLRKIGILEGVIIYSNNGSIVILEFVRDVLEMAVGSKIFDELIDFYHPLREKVLVKTDIRKTWVELRRLLVEGRCGAPTTVKPERVVFIDDQIHNDLVSTLGSNYVKVATYSGGQDALLFGGVFNELLEDAAFMGYAGSCLGRTGLVFSETQADVRPEPDFSIKLMITVLKMLRNDTMKRQGGKTKRSRRKNRNVSMKKY